MSTRDSADLRRAVTRLTWQFTSLLVVLLTLTGLVLYAIVAAGTAEGLNKSLHGAIQVDSPRDAPSGVFLAIAEDNQVSASPQIPPGLPDIEAMKRVAESGSTEQGRVNAGGRTFEVLTTVHGDRVIQASADTHEGDESLRRVLGAVIMSTGAAAVVAALISLWMARRAIQPLADSLALQRRFVADASHELRTPLTLLSTRAQMLLRRIHSTESANDAVSADVQHIVEDTKILSGILDDLLISADPRVAAKHSDVNLAVVARDAIEQAAVLAAQKTLQIKGPGSTDEVLVEGSPVALLRVFTALLSNAMDFAETSITVTVNIDGKDAKIQVSDDGPGFPAGSRDQIFERFASSRADQESARPSSRHYGLGLALVAEIVALHHGSVETGTATHHRGAMVTVTLPLAATHK